MAPAQDMHMVGVLFHLRDKICITLGGVLAARVGGLTVGYPGIYS